MFLHNEAGYFKEKEKRDNFYDLTATLLWRPAYIITESVITPRRGSGSREKLMNLISRAEELVLLAIISLGDNAYGISILEFLQEKTGNAWSFAQIYDPLDKLTRKGYVKKRKGGSTPERGGRPKSFYKLTADGRGALVEIRKVQDAVWSSIPVKSLT
jgi:DNA-binding PadR family transcriptional regulator